MKILLVDDSNIMRKMQKNLLMQSGISNAVEASNGKEALDVLEKDKEIDTILLDWNMPVMDGFTFLKTVRKNSAYNNIKIIMCTSESEKKNVIVAMREGLTNYIVKPFTSEILQEKLGL